MSTPPFCPRCLVAFGDSPIKAPCGGYFCVGCAVELGWHGEAGKGEEE